MDVVHTACAVTALDGAGPFDLVIVAVEAPALEAIIPTLAPAIGPETCIVPLLNGMVHFDLLSADSPAEALSVRS